MSYGDINRIIYGYDDCGNICGMKNTVDTIISCKVTINISMSDAKSLHI